MITTLSATNLAIFLACLNTTLFIIIAVVYAIEKIKNKS